MISLVVLIPIPALVLYFTLIVALPNEQKEVKCQHMAKHVYEDGNDEE